MKTTIISYERAVENDLAREVLEGMGVDFDSDDTEENGPFIVFDGDPDQLRIEGETVQFTDLEDKDKGVRTVLYSNHAGCDEDIVVKMLQEFYEEDEDGRATLRKYYEDLESTNENMRNLETGIAYRGGAGYIFALHTYKDNDKIFN